jgi:hypothetical protein
MTVVLALRCANGLVLAAEAMSEAGIERWTELEGEALDRLASD